MIEITHIFLAQGPSLQLGKAQELSRLREKYAPWLTDSIDKNLMPFEKSIREIAAISSTLPSLQVGPQRTSMVEKQYELFSRLIGLNPNDPTEEDTLFAATSYLRNLLNINEFTNIRKETVTDSK